MKITNVEKGKIRQVAAKLYMGNNQFSRYEYYEVICGQYKRGELNREQLEMAGLNRIITQDQPKEVNIPGIGTVETGVERGKIIV